MMEGWPSDASADPGRRLGQGVSGAGGFEASQSGPERQGAISSPSGIGSACLKDGLTCAVLEKVTRIEPSRKCQWLLSMAADRWANEG